MNAGDRPPIAERPSPLRRLTKRLSSWLDGRTQFRHRIPIRGRIALFGAAVVAVTVVIFSVVVYAVVERSLVSQQDSTLTHRGDTAWTTIVRSGGHFAPLRQFLPADLNASPEVFLQIFEPNGASVFSSGKIDGIDPQYPSSLLSNVPFDHGVRETTPSQNGPLMRVSSACRTYSMTFVSSCWPASF
jgi:hypothetical protein